MERSVDAPIVKKPSGFDYQSYVFGVVTGILMAALCGYIIFNKNYVPDNPLEELVEEVIEHHTGVDIDLSP